MARMPTFDRVVYVGGPNRCEKQHAEVRPKMYGHGAEKNNVG